MKRNILVILSLAAFFGICCSQTVVVTDFTIASGNKVPYIKTFQNQWNNQLEFAVYGWIRVNAWVNNEIQVFRLSANQDINSNTLGDRVLKSFVQDNKIMFETYDSQNWDPKVQHGYLNQGDRFGQWFFIYQGYNPATTKTFGWVQNAAGQGQGGYSNNYARHTTSNFYQVIIGPNQGVTNGDKVDVKILWVQAGKGAYRERDFDLRQSNPTTPTQPVTPTNPVTPTTPTKPATPTTPTKPNTTPVPNVKCPTVYSECNFKGQSVGLCDGIPALKIPQIRSVVIPPGFNKITLHNLKNYQGKTVVFDKTDACIDDSKVQFGLYQKDMKTSLKQNMNKTRKNQY